MKKAYVLAFSGALFAMSAIQPASAATLRVVNKTALPALVTVTYHTRLCKDDRGVHVAPNQAVTLKVGLCTVNTVYASVTTHPGFALTCIPKKRTGASSYAVTVDDNLKNCYVN